MKRLLLIDDSKLYLAIIQRFLLACPIEVYTATNFEVAERLIPRICPDIVCVDQHMGDRSQTGDSWVISKHYLMPSAEIAIITASPESVRYSAALSQLGIEVVEKVDASETIFWQRIRRQCTPASGANFRYVSVFISYGGPDESYAERLHLELKRHGVRSFFFRESAPFGRKLHRVMRDGIQSSDRVLLLCSEASLDRPGVMNELEETLAREAREGGKERLIPLTLDDYVYSWKPQRIDLATAIRDRVIGDFRGTRNAHDLFSAKTSTLLRVLRTAAV